MRLFDSPRQVFVFLGFLVTSLALYSVTLKNSAEFHADGGFANFQPKSAQSFVQSIGVTTHLTYNDYKQNAFFSDVFNNLVKPKIRELGIYHVRQYPGEVDSNFPTYVSKYNELSNPPAGYPRISFNFETYVDPSVSSNPQNSCYLPKMKYIWFGTVGNCNGLQNYTSPSSVDAVSVENPNEPDHCASFICSYSPNSSNWYGYSIQQNSNWPDDVLQTAQAANTKLKGDSQTSNLEILAPAFVWLPYHQNETYNGTNLRTYLEPLKSYITHGNAHPYCNLESVATCFSQQVQPYIDYYSPKPVIVTETGHSTAQYSETIQAKYILRILFDFFERGIPRTYVYELLDEPTASNSTQQTFGILNEDGREKPGFTWLKNTISLLKDSGNVSLRDLPMNISGNNLRQTLLQKSDGSHWLAIQYDKNNTTDTDATTQATISFASVKNIEYFSPSATTAYKTENGVTSLSMSVPDKITLLKISDPASNTTNNNSNTNSNSNSNSTTKKSTAKSNSGTTNNNNKEVTPPPADTVENGLTLTDPEVHLTKNISVGRNAFAIVLILTILAIATLATWYRLRKEFKNTEKSP